MDENADRKAAKKASRGAYLLEFGVIVLLAALAAYAGAA
jgi:hypothetical protein